MTCVPTPRFKDLPPKTAAAGLQLARRFFSRVADRSSWVSSNLRESTQNSPRINSKKSTGKQPSDYSSVVSEALLRQLVRHVLNNR